jgi:hypothetical protein
MIIIFQILFIAFALFAIISVLKKKISNNLGFKATVFWILFWVLAVVVVLLPNSTTMIANQFGIGRGVDFIFYISLAIIFFLLFKLNVKLDSLNRDITKVIREKAINKEDKKTK